jgi:hypothetical protein
VRRPSAAVLAEIPLGRLSVATIASAAVLKVVLRARARRVTRSYKAQIHPGHDQWRKLQHRVHGSFSQGLGPIFERLGTPDLVDAP